MCRHGVVGSAYCLLLTAYCLLLTAYSSSIVRRPILAKRGSILYNVAWPYPNAKILRPRRNIMQRLPRPVLYGLVLTLTVALTACGGNTPTTPTTPTATSQSTTIQTPTG